MDRPIIGITMGDPSGIGPEICVKALTSPEINRIARCIVFGDLHTLKKGARIAKFKNINFKSIQSIDQADFLSGDVINVFDFKNVDPAKVKPGKVSRAAGRAAIEYLEKAIQLAKDKKIDAITTGPINKESIHKAGFHFKGHTEILAKRTHTKKYGMLFVADAFWVILVTTHLALKDVSKHITKSRVLDIIRLAHETVIRSGKKDPKIGVAGLNPHAGEAGAFGKEEIKHIKPAIEAAAKEGINVKGPISPDAIFYLANAGLFDIVVAMYHDQGLIPLKLVSFNRSVNMTAGLPIIRTSVDHGTGFDIVGKGWANPNSLMEAIKVAAHFAKVKTAK